MVVFSECKGVGWMSGFRQAHACEVTSSSSRASVQSIAGLDSPPPTLLSAHSCTPRLGSNGVRVTWKACQVMGESRE